jgi:hypothetical protein
VSLLVPRLGHRLVVDELIETYICWREECTAVQAAYDGWSAALLATGEERLLRFAVYRAALDREDRAARAYMECGARLDA